MVGGKPASYWVEALQSPDAKLRQKAAFRLGNVGPSDPAAFPALLGALKDNNADVRCEAIKAVLKCGSAAKEAITALTDLEQHDADARVRSHAAKAITKLQADQS
jgi:HEAT repeat protein